EILVADVPGDGQSAAAGEADHLRGVLGVLVFVLVDDGDVRPLAGEGDGRGAADAGVAAGDDRDLAQELAAAAVGLLAGDRLRAHAGLEAGLAALPLAWALVLLALVAA